MGGVVRCLAVLSSLNMVIGETWCSFIMPKAVVQSADSRFVIECNWQQVRKHLVPKSSHKGHLAICRVSPSSRNLCKPFGCAAWVTAVPQENVHKTAARLSGGEFSLLSISSVLILFSCWHCPPWGRMRTQPVSGWPVSSLTLPTAFYSRDLPLGASPPYSGKKMVALKATEKHLRLTQILLNCQTVRFACESTEGSSSCVWAEQLY